MFLICRCPSEKYCQGEDGAPEIGDLWIFSRSCPSHFPLFSLFEFSLSRQSLVSPSFNPLTTWAATLCYCHMSERRPPHHSSLWLARPFQVGEPLPDNNLVWLLEQRSNWLICSPCLGPGFWSSLVDPNVCAGGCLCGGGGLAWLWREVLDKHTHVRCTD